MVLEGFVCIVDTRHGAHALIATTEPPDHTGLRCLMQGALAHRVLGLLWELTFAPGAPAEVAQSPVLSDSLHHYAGMGSDGIDMVWDYIKRCISQVMLCCHDMPP